MSMVTIPISIMGLHPNDPWNVNNNNNKVLSGSNGLVKLFLS